MAEEARGILSSDGVECGAEGVMQRRGGERGEPAQFGLQLGPGGLDGVQVRRACGQVTVGEAGAVEQPRTAAVLWARRLSSSSTASGCVRRSSGSRTRSRWARNTAPLVAASTLIVASMPP